MKERPILFSPPMVRAILAGRKTQTRRLVKLDDLTRSYSSPTITNPADNGGFLLERWPRQEREFGNFGRCARIHCPQGQPGDLLWVIERFKAHRCQRDGYPRIGFVYLADDSYIENSRAGTVSNIEKWKPSIHMPRWACRLFLDLADVRCQRLQDITREDVRAEGIPETYGEVPGWVEERFPGMAGHEWDNLRWDEQWAKAWDSINGDRGAWSTNPWVWVLDFTMKGNTK